MADQILDLLNQLGTTADEVADTLLAQGIRGRNGDSGACPVQVFLAKHGYFTVHVENCGILTSSISEARCHGKSPEDIRICPLTDAVEEFVERFDDGVYPNLEI